MKSDQQTLSGPHIVKSPRKTALIAAVLCFSFSGCARDRYVTVSCLTPQQYSELREALPPKVGAKLTGNAGEDIKIIAGSNVRLRGYAEGLLNVLSGCVG